MSLRAILPCIALSLSSLVACDRVQVTVAVNQPASAGIAASAPHIQPVSTEELPDYTAMTLEQKVRASTVVVIGRFAGSPPECRVSEVLKVSTDVKPPTVGARLPLCDQPTDPTYRQQEGQLHFLGGNPPGLRQSVSIYEGHIPALEGQPLDQVKARIAGYVPK